MIKTSFKTIIFFLLFSACQAPQLKQNPSGDNPDTNSYKPLARYWWFASEIKKKDVRYNLNWLKENGFGGVELAWVYPLNARKKPVDTVYTPRQPWLSPAWQEIVEYTMHYADSLGLQCDFTLGTLWPFGDSYVLPEQASRNFSGDIQTMRLTWEHPKQGYVVDHLNRKHYLAYLRRMIDSLPDPGTEFKHAGFIDSWEVKTELLWTDHLDDDFTSIYGYDIKPWMDQLYEPENRDVLYDYRKLISEKVIRFYADFDSILRASGFQSRGQCSGAPCDIISAYANIAIPEGEAMLYEPEYNQIPASAALLSDKKFVTAETFTCLYGWPDNYMRQEQTADLKLVADALFANGINRIVWHGKPHNPADYDTVNFYATVHLGKEGALASELQAFNGYLSEVSAFMQQGEPYTDIAVYLPTEDAWMKGEMPKEKQFIWAKEYYEMRYIYLPEVLAGFQPTWINNEFLQKASYKDGKLYCGQGTFSALYVGTDHLDISTLLSILKLARAGLPVCLTHRPEQAGTLKHPGWDRFVDQLLDLPHVSSEFDFNITPLVQGEKCPPFRARKTDNSLFIFFAHPNSKGLKFPLEYGQSFTVDTIVIPVTIHYQNQEYPVDLTFLPYRALLYSLEDGKLKQVELSFEPKTPVVKPRPKDFEERWLVK
ncbi:MAG: hypothetical protein KDC05_12550 [Bacteroidales bacterium]|nr:hypothetical protein [Bacteroidales bacterium]